MIPVFPLTSKHPFSIRPARLNCFGLALLFSLLGLVASAQPKDLKREIPLQYFGRESFLIEGTAIADSLKESPYDRLPASYRNKVRKPVWDLSKNSAGLSVRFLSNSTSIKVRWTVLNNFEMNHMAATGVKGLDLYCKVNGAWRFVNTAKPTGKENEYLLVNHMVGTMREFRLFLPLYDGVTDLKIGIDSLSEIKKPQKSPLRPIVFYGTSITQGGCASRPGMAYTNIISRKLNRECINFGFSGNGRMEHSIAELLAGMKPFLYVIDCVPNMTAVQIGDSMAPLTATIRKKDRLTPIVFVEGVFYQKSFLDTAVARELAEKNRVLRKGYEDLLKRGYKNIYYVESSQAIGADHEGTVDGVHFTDLGFMRFADFLISRFRQNGLLKDRPQ